MRKRTFTSIMAVFIIILALSLLWATFASAEISNEELLKSQHLNDSQRTALANAIRKAEEHKLPASAVELKKWQEFGDAFAITIKSIAHTLNVEANAFLDSDVGIIVAGAIIYKVMGKDILRIIIYGGAALAFTFMIGASLLIFHKGKKVVQIEGDNKTTEYIDRFEWEDTAVKNASMILHMVVWVIIIIILTVNAI